MTITATKEYKCKFIYEYQYYTLCINNMAAKETFAMCCIAQLMTHTMDRYIAAAYLATKLLSLLGYCRE